MDVGLLSILSGSASVVTAGGEESPEQNPLDAQPFGAMMARATQKAGPNSETMMDNAQIGQMIDQVPAMLLNEGNAEMIAEWAQAQGLTVTASEIATLAANIVDQREISGSADAMLSPLDMEPVAWSVEEPVMVEVTEDGEIIKTDLPINIEPQIDTVLKSIEAEEVVPSLTVQDDEMVDVELIEEQVDVLIGDAQADAIEVVEVTAEEVVTPLMASSDQTAMRDVTVSVDSPKAAVGSTTPAQPAQGATPTTPATPGATPTAPTNAATEAPPADADLDAVIERVLNQPTKAPANPTNANQNVMYQAAPQPVNQVPAFDVAQATAQTETVDKIDILSPQNSSVSHTTTHEGADRFASLHVLKADPTYQGRAATVSEQVQVTVRQAIQVGLDRVVIELEPADLGRVEVRMDVAKEGRVQVVVIADNRDTLDLLRQDSRSLERALQEAGLDADAGDMEFQLGREDSDGEYDDAQAQAYGEVVEDARTPDEHYIDPMTGQYMVMVNEGLDIKV